MFATVYFLKIIIELLCIYMVDQRCHVKIVAKWRHQWHIFVLRGHYHATL